MTFLQNSPASGAPTIHLRRGTYVASHAALDRDVVTYTGRRREGNPDRLYAEHTRSVRLRAGEWIDWHSEPPERVA
jgi:hypothetical protein